MKYFDKSLFAKNIKSFASANNIRIRNIEKEIKVSPGYISRLASEDNNSSFPIMDLLIYMNKEYAIPMNSLLFSDLTDIPSVDYDILFFIEKLSQDTSDGILHWDLEDSELLSNKEYIQDHPLFIIIGDLDIASSEKYVSQFRNVSLVDGIYSTYINNHFLFIAKIQNNDNQKIGYEMYFAKERKNYSRTYPICEIYEESPLFPSIINLTNTIDKFCKKVILNTTVKHIINKYLRS